MPRIILSEFVEDELDAIWQYIALDNVAAADRFVDAVDDTLQRLSRMPGMGRKRNFPHSRLTELRSFCVKGFENILVFYGPTSDGIEVFHVIHGARDIDRYWEAE
jgi:toxin ParE1/3/4